MSITITATVGADDANSFVTLAEANTYFNARPDGACWSPAGAPEQQRALVYAGKQLNAMKWYGMRVDSEQAMAWPRAYVPIPDGYTYFDTDVIPQQVKDAQCELALSVIEDGIDAGSGSADGVTSFAGSGISVQYGKAGAAGSAARSRVDQLLAGLTAGARLMRA
jgi:hypothetical protein